MGQGASGQRGLGIKESIFDPATGNLSFNMTDNSTQGSFAVRGAAGAPGSEGRGIASAELDAAGKLYITMNDGKAAIPANGTTAAVAALPATKYGPFNVQGRGIAGAELDNTGNLYIILNDAIASTATTAAVPATKLGPFPVKGDTGVGIDTLRYDPTDGNLYVKRSNETTATPYYIKGADGVGIKELIYNDATGEMSMKRSDDTTQRPFSLERAYKLNFHKINKCLDTSADAATGYLGACDSSSTTQKFYYDPTLKQLKNSDKTQCLTTSATGKWGWSACDITNTDQRLWHVNDALKTTNNKCFDTSVTNLNSTCINTTPDSQRFIFQ